jgi:uncharacterized repeat protein (TIGR03803 family)
MLHRFAGGTDGANPEAGMVFDKAGNLYGMTSTGGAHRGVVYELSPAASGTWTEKILHRFASNGTDGYAPVHSNVAVDASGNFLAPLEVGHRAVELFSKSSLKR